MLVRMTSKSVPFTRSFVEKLTETYPTPFHIYDERAIREHARRFASAFSWVGNGTVTGFKNFFAVKALPNPYIMKIVRQEGMGFDCSSMAELVLAEKVGASGSEIMFSSNDTPVSEYRKAIELGATLNLDDITHIEFIEKSIGLPKLLCFRYNPGPLKKGNVIIGKPEEAKYGFTREQIIEGYRIAKQKGCTRFGLHTMVASNELDPDYFVETAAILFDLAKEVLDKTGVRIEFVNLGGGIGIPYRPEQTAVDYDRVSAGIRNHYRSKIEGSALDPLRIVMENGRVVTGPYGYLVSRAIHRKETYKHYVGLDSSMANLMRPGMYGAYHHVTVLGKERAAATETYDVTGSLCENNDKFAIDRKLPPIEIGDFVVIHDTGAHGHAMGFNYNGKLRSAELLLREDGSVELIRRAETLTDHFGTLDFSRL